jgi:glycosyltransferase involved in cell wall biosynthesis
MTCISSDVSPFLSVIVPCFNERELLEECVDQLRSWMAAHGVSCEIIIVDDGSTDGSVDIARRIASRWPGVSVHALGRNRGVGRAISEGLERAAGVFAFVQCVDMPFDIDNLAEILPALDDECDVFVVARVDRSANTVFRRLTSIVNYYLIRLLFGVPLPDYQFVQFYRVGRIQRFLPLRSDGSFAPPELQIRSWKDGLKFKHRRLTFHERRGGEAKYGSPARLVQSIREILSYRLLGHGEGRR